MEETPHVMPARKAPINWPFSRVGDSPITGSELFLDNEIGVPWLRHESEAVIKSNLETILLMVQGCFKNFFIKAVYAFFQNHVAEKHIRRHFFYFIGPAPYSGSTLSNQIRSEFKISGSLAPVVKP